MSFASFLVPLMVVELEPLEELFISEHSQFQSFLQEPNVKTPNIPTNAIAITFFIIVVNKLINNWNKHKSNYLILQVMKPKLPQSTLVDRFIGSFENSFPKKEEKKSIVSIERNNL